jgi:hypothetical protein
MPNLIDQNGVAIPREFHVVYQVIFRIAAKDDNQAKKAVDSGMSMRASMAPLLIGMGIDAKPMNAENLRELGIDVGNPMKA